MDIPEELAFGRLSCAEKYHRAVPGYMKRLGDLYEAIYERFEEEGLALIRDVSREYGTRIAMNVGKRGGLKGVTQVGRYLLKVFDMVTGEWEVGEFSEDRLIIVVHRCPCAFSLDGLVEAAKRGAQ
ncbi:hypothetical protein K8I85_10975 [bacterium]|nr:hypothetical protein [bacterium]